ncbi:hypothetical protein OIU84_026873 [Salix udensis]|uniref:NAB domain-containing protein n=1 Tax=Salix udensis TaxID=889485 RepID=A0AAD6KGB9_9ROSI|nr:hypothetical protein OIU84_026873 [Salix udensis]
MDQSVKRMLKLIEEDGDSFAKKAEMYYQKRPELISHVEEFYRMYRSLAERYDHVTGELRKSVPSDIQSQGSGISDVISEPPSPAREQKPSCRKSESESDDSSVNNFSGLSGNSGDQGLSRRIIDLEIELRETKEKLRMQQDGSVDGSFRGAINEDSEDVLAEITGYERDLTIANERLRLAEDEVTRLNNELQKYRSSEISDGLLSELASPAESKVTAREVELEFEVNQASHPQQRIGWSEAETLDSNVKVQSLMEELKIAKERISLRWLTKEINTLKNKLNAEKREVSKLQERSARLKTSLSDRDREVRDLKIAVSDAEQKIFPEKAQIMAEMSKVIEERTCCEEQLKEQESRCRSLEDDIRMFQAEKAEMQETLEHEIQQLKEDIAGRHSCIENLVKSFDSLKSERDQLREKAITLEAEVTCRDNRINQMDRHLQQLHMEHVKLIAGAEEARKLMGESRSKAKDLAEEVERQRMKIVEGAEEKREAIRQLCIALEHYRDGYHSLRQVFAGHKRAPVLAT